MGNVALALCAITWPLGPYPLAVPVTDLQRDPCGEAVGWLKGAALGAG